MAYYIYKKDPQDLFIEILARIFEKKNQQTKIAMIGILYSYIFHHFLAFPPGCSPTNLERRMSPFPLSNGVVEGKGEVEGQIWAKGAGLNFLIKSPGSKCARLSG